MGTLFESDESTIEHSDMYRAAEDLVDVYKQMVFDMVDHCKTDEAINECKAENFEKCEKQVGCSESKFNLAMILKSTLITWELPAGSFKHSLWAPLISLTARRVTSANVWKDSKEKR